jgi:hypothetical protein
VRTKRETVEAYWDASAKSDYAGPCVASGYTWIDHIKGVTATSMEQLLEAQAEDAAWSDRSFDINKALETTDGALIDQATVSGTLTGEWCLSSWERTAGEFRRLRHLSIQRRSPHRVRRALLGCAHRAEAGGRIVADLDDNVACTAAPALVGTEGEGVAGPA